ncbi:hypothetical protein V2T60_06590 [Streptococcus agalactiae]
MTTTTLEKLYSHYPATASILPYKDWVIVATPTYKGIVAEIYKYESLSEYTNRMEADLNLEKTSEETFQDQGHAVKWAFEILGA